jgi:hypothetical protein
VLEERMEDQMSKAVSRDQVAELGARFLRDVAWGQIDHDALQHVIELSPAELGRLLTGFLKDICKLRTNSPHPYILTIDRSQSFDPREIIGTEWSIDKENDKRAFGLTSVDFSKVIFESGISGDYATTITGKEKLKYLKAGKMVRLDAKCGQALLSEKGQATLRFLYDTYGIGWMEFAGTILRHCGGGQYFPCLCRHDDGLWYWSVNYLGDLRDSTRVSPLIPSA